MADQVRVFVSHHHTPDEDAFTARLVADLEAVGADVWVDDQRISSNNFVQKISEGLEGRQWLVLVMTPQSVASSWVRNEVNTALSEHTAGRMLGIVPIVMVRTPEQDIPMLWRPLHRYNATHAYEPARDGLLRALGLSALVQSGAPSRWSRRLGAKVVWHHDEASLRRRELDGLLRDVEHDRDALSAFLYHVQLGDESGHVISHAAGLDIWYDHILATREIPDLMVNWELDEADLLRHTLSQKRDIDAALSKLFRLYARLPQLRQTLHEELTQDEGAVLWRDYVAWEQADKRPGSDPVSQWNERQQLGRRWHEFKTTSQITQKREACRRAFVEAREQCEVIMGMATEELAGLP